MGRRYVYDKSEIDIATLEARLSNVVFRRNETDTEIECVIDGPSYMEFERNQPACASMVEPVEDGSRTKLEYRIPVDEWDAVIAAEVSEREVVANRLAGAMIREDNLSVVSEPKPSKGKWINLLWLLPVIATVIPVAIYLTF